MLPTTRLLGLTGLIAAAGLVPAWQPTLFAPWQAAAGLVVLLAGLDAWRLYRSPRPVVARRVPGSLALGVATPVHLRLEPRGARPVSIRVHDHHPQALVAEHLPRQATLQPGRRTDVTYLVTPEVRGEHAFGPVQIRERSPFGLWQRDSRLPQAQTVRVYPNFAAVSRYTLLATDHRLAQMGVRRRRRRGEGQDFHQLREYRQGDTLRQIDWKATARRHQLISREYQEERDQEIVFLLDCGQRMLTRDDALSHFDHSLNAVLLLAWVALRQGDAVGLGTFGGAGRWLRPVKGSARIDHLFNLLYDLQPTTAIPDYAAAASALLARQKKRALVVIVTNLRDEDSHQLLPAVRLLQRRHLVLVASLREQALDAATEAPVRHFDDALRVAAAHDYRRARRRAVEALQAGGALCLDVTPDRLSVDLVNQYLAIKTAGRL